MIEFGFDFGMVGVSSEDAHGVRLRCPLRAWFDKRLHYRLALGTGTPDDQNKFVVTELHVLTCTNIFYCLKRAKGRAASICPFPELTRICGECEPTFLRRFQTWLKKLARRRS